MQFTIIALDATDPDAKKRRLACRKDHLALHAKLRLSGNMLYGGAILSDSGEMIGSNILAEFPSQKECDAWIASDPYVVGKVWENITVYPFRSAPGY